MIRRSAMAIRSISSFREATTEQSTNIKVTIGRKEVRLYEYHAKVLVSMLQKELNKEYSRRKDAYEHECPVCGQRNNEIHNSKKQKAHGTPWAFFVVQENHRQFEGVR